MIKVLSKEFQHSCESTALMLWESALLMASIINSNPTIVAGKRVLELGCGCGGICSIVAVRSADLVVATDGDANALDLLTQNVEANLKSPFLDKLITRRLEWGIKTVLKWPEGILTSSSKSVISCWFSENVQDYVPSTALNIMYFKKG
ncbi:hypothetical protein Acr_14g0005590 [Actinidia rufa]|uniref:S-adenosyl-L-methionine-dependent methyltransferases superfamily protein n=1 Tax=Actinidia rufa TaxID=165716 RepID=A0A7J0FQR8_9ERIC|nr:hypothetical protein Acr_14g0005590 [Actinidia rufa]